MSNLLHHEKSGPDYILAGNTTNPKRMIVLLHGQAGDCESIQGHIADPLGRSLENTLFLIPNGPVSLAHEISEEQEQAIRQMQVSAGGQPTFDRNKAFNWAGEASFSPEEGDHKGMLRAIEEVVPPIVCRLNTLIDDQLEAFGLTDKQLGFYGFSAGGMMALYTAIARPQVCAGVVSHSGHFPGARKALSAPPILMMYGKAEWGDDETRPILQRSIDLLRGFGLSVEQHGCRNLGHGVNAESHETAMLFFKGWFERAGQLYKPGCNHSGSHHIQPT